MKEAVSSFIACIKHGMSLRLSKTWVFHVLFIKPYLLSYYKYNTKRGYKSPIQTQTYLFPEVLLKLTLIHIPLPLKGPGKKETGKK